ncbi:MAG TPA: IS1 family transposase, partial [Alphaproteobacteria bacterium]
VDYAQLVKIYGTAPEAARGRYSPAVCIGARKENIEGNPDPARVSTSHVERQNLTMRMQMRRFTRLTNAFSKKIENHCHALALYFVWYNFCRQHKAHRLSPAMAAGLADTLHDMEWIVGLVDARAPKPGPRGPYRKQNSN